MSKKRVRYCWYECWRRFHDFIIQFNNLFKYGDEINLQFHIRAYSNLFGALTIYTKFHCSGWSVVCVYFRSVTILLSYTPMRRPKWLIFSVLKIVIYLCSSHTFVYLPENWLLFFIFYLVIVHKLFFLLLPERMEW